jgi:hypothetical protein
MKILDFFKSLFQAKSHHNLGDHLIGKCSCSKLNSNWDKLFVPKDKLFSVDVSVNEIKRKICSCGGEIITTGKGIKRQVCSECGKLYHDFIYEKENI